MDLTSVQTNQVAIQKLTMQHLHVYHVYKSTDLSKNRKHFLKYSGNSGMSISPGCRLRKLREAQSKKRCTLKNVYYSIRMVMMMSLFKFYIGNATFKAVYH